MYFENYLLNVAGIFVAFLLVLVTIAVLHHYHKNRYILYFQKRPHKKCVFVSDDEQKRLHPGGKLPHRIVFPLQELLDDQKKNSKSLAATRQAAHFLHNTHANTKLVTKTGLLGWLWRNMPSIPYLSVWIQWCEDPILFLEKASELYGPVFTISSYFKEWTFMVGEGTNKFFFDAKQLDEQAARDYLYKPLIMNGAAVASTSSNASFKIETVPPKTSHATTSSSSSSMTTTTPTREEIWNQDWLYKSKTFMKEGFTNKNALVKYLENIKREVRSLLFHQQHINLKFVDRNEKTAIAEMELPTPKILHKHSDSFFPDSSSSSSSSSGAGSNQGSQQPLEVVVVNDLFSQMSKFVVRSLMRSVLGSSFVKRHGDEVTDNIVFLETQIHNPFVTLYYNHLRSNLLEYVWMPSVIEQIETKKKRVHYLISSEIERRVKMMEFENLEEVPYTQQQQHAFSHQSLPASQPSLQRNVSSKEDTTNLHYCYIDFILERNGSDKYGGLHATTSIYANHIMCLLVESMSSVAALGWTIAHVASDSTLQDRLRMEVNLFKEKLEKESSQFIRSMWSEATSSVRPLLPHFSPTTISMATPQHLEAFTQPATNLSTEEFDTISGQDNNSLENSEGVSTITDTSLTNSAGGGGGLREEDVEELRKQSMLEDGGLSSTADDTQSHHTSTDTNPPDSIPSLSIPSSPGPLSMRATSSTEEMFRVQQQQPTQRFTRAVPLLGNPPFTTSPVDHTPTGDGGGEDQSSLKEPSVNTDSGGPSNVNNTIVTTPTAPKPSGLAKRRPSFTLLSGGALSTSSPTKPTETTTSILPPSPIHTNTFASSSERNPVLGRGGTSSNVSTSNTSGSELSSHMSSNYNMRLVESILQSNACEDPLKLLDSCLKEAARIYSLKLFTKQTLEGMNFHNLTIPANHLVCVSPFFVHRDEEVYPYDANTYRPDRFNLGEVGNLRQLAEEDHAFIGLKGFAGSNFTMLSSKLFLMELLSNYQVETPQLFASDFKGFGSVAMPTQPIALILNPLS
ncbi:hypothetical protein C9374_008776 [Naegleria lovaniensis]|uniref:Cytochrome P450 n=1 Tax=Naegleria lovaniensis TaxID=51637 RepID=A0AA88GIL1_NAELO|nr:uncharacterized protein C9374_008776 [Naegleria lovaniensis]KAG2378154.1 hypothetical protein C9374_008776 [Naegleria lovaniensis]